MVPVAHGGQKHSILFPDVGKRFFQGCQQDQSGRNRQSFFDHTGNHRSQAFGHEHDILIFAPLDIPEHFQGIVQDIFQSDLPVQGIADEPLFVAHVLKMLGSEIQERDLTAPCSRKRNNDLSPHHTASNSLFSH